VTDHRKQIDVRGVLQAGGRGGRIGADERTGPKPLFSVDGTPMVERLLRQLVAAGIRDVTVIAGWMGDRVEAHLRSLDDLPGDLAIDFIRESEPRGNMGALADLPRESRPVLMAFGDLVTDLDFAELVAVHEKGGARTTLASHYESHRVRLGELQTEGRRVVGYREKPEKRFLICSGIGVFERPVLDLLPSDRPAGIADLVTAALDGGHDVIHWNHGAFWMDVNSRDELEEAGRELAARRLQRGT